MISILFIWLRDMASTSRILVALILSTVISGLSIAHGADIASAQTLSNAASIFSLVLDVVYVLLRPLLIVSGRALDNSLVLGEIINLDRPLFQFWRTMTTFANFGLAFVVLTEIAKHLRGQSDQKAIFTTIKKALFAGIGIQVSWFVMIALLDISTIAIYSIGAMPLSVVDDTDVGNQYIVEPIINMNNTNAGQTQSSGLADSLSKSVSYTCGGGFGDIFTGANNDQVIGTKSIQACHVTNNYIVARRPYLAGDSNEDSASISRERDPINHEYCVYQQEIYKVYDNEKYLYIPLNAVDSTANIAPPTSFEGQNTLGATITYDFDTNEREGKMLADARVTADRGCMQFKDLQDSATGMAGVMTTIFSSILGFADITSNPNNESMGRLSAIFLIKMLMGLALIAPLIVLAIALIKRVGWLWLALVASPILVVLNVFGYGEKIEFLKKLSFAEVIKMIFMPVVTVFALSIGIVFLSALDKAIADPIIHDNETSTQALGSFGITPYTDSVVDSSGSEVDAQCYTILITTICYQSDGSNGVARNNFLNYFSRVIVNLFGIGVLWMIVFASYKFSPTLSGFAEDVAGLAKKMALSIPIIPIPGQKGKDGKQATAGLGAVFGGGGQQSMIDRYNATLGAQINDQQTRLLNNDSSDVGSDKKALEKHIATIKKYSANQQTQVDEYITQHKTIFEKAIPEGNTETYGNWNISNSAQKGLVASYVKQANNNANKTNDNKNNTD